MSHLDAAPNTETFVEVKLLVIARCPVCGKTIEERGFLDEESLSTGNTTQRASYQAIELRRLVDDKKRRRFWDDTMCGECRVRKAEEQP